MFGFTKKKAPNPELESLPGLRECIDDGQSDAFPEECCVPPTVRWSDPRCVGVCYGGILPKAIKSSAVSAGFKYGPAYMSGRRFLCGIGTYRATPSELVGYANRAEAYLQPAGKVKVFCSHDAAKAFFAKAGMAKMRTCWEQPSPEILAISASLLQNEIEQRMWIFPSQNDQVRPEVTACLESLARFDPMQPVTPDLMSLLILAEALRHHRRPVVLVPDGKGGYVARDANAFAAEKAARIAELESRWKDTPAVIKERQGRTGRGYPRRRGP